MYVHKPKDTDKHEHFIKHLVYILTVTLCTRVVRSDWRSFVGKIHVWIPLERKTLDFLYPLHHDLEYREPLGRVPPSSGSFEEEVGLYPYKRHREVPPDPLRMGVLCHLRLQCRLQPLCRSRSWGWRSFRDHSLSFL
ncbi:hypothetical protein GW17_00057661 [Ensete ventricosum]|nr:hypothetical protein GW17_00057661 [Ensete ventricosum]